MKMGITINEAIAENAIKGQIIKDACQKIDALIIQNIEEILKKPVTLPFDLITIDEYRSDIQAMYVDFTLCWDPYNGYIGIKLSDKDWDWDGYGVKKEDAPIAHQSSIEKKKRCFDLGLPMWWSKKLHV